MADQPSWHQEVIHLRQKHQDIWDFEHRQHQLFLELANDHLDQLENTLMERSMSERKAHQPC